ncbi:branched-chain-amino-acid aminotransferase, cytosolic-like [Drosophila sulfurigaster albostrigata]|nr:branched-chain-amino-acid aminotransferase, cytosolic-like [Drosophila sulfurigaster albostrigata]
MLKIYYHKSLGGWQKPEITPLENLVMHPAAKVLHYAVELFEGMKAYRGVDGIIRIFRQMEAAARGLQQVLWLYGEDHQLTEVGTMNIFMFYVNDQGEQELITPPLNGLILPGITRDSILDMTRQWGKFKVREATFTMPMVSELLNQGRLLELFGTGTACVVSPINRINYLGQDLYIPTMEQEKPVHELIRETLTDIQYGKVDHPWSVVID